MSAGLAIVGAVIAVDTLARRAGVYRDASEDWPAGYRATALPPASPDAPYRALNRVVWLRALDAGVPRTVSIPLLVVFGLAVAWSLCAVLAVGDVADVFRGTRGAPRVFASLALCVMRALAGWAVVAYAAPLGGAGFARSTALALALDGALWAFPLPCSDHRDDDVVIARWGFAAHASLAVGYGWSLWRRRGLDFTAPEKRPPLN